MAKTIMVQGTASNAGKSILTAALCRIFKQDGYRVAPFKAQNMALNSYITKDGFEMGRAQVMQAEAASILPDVRMNPILLKPTSDSGSQLIVMGDVTGNFSAQDYYKQKQILRPVVQQAFEQLSKEYDIIVIEGAGSPAEINLKQDDLVNMGMAKMAHAPVLLVGDIDRGGVFASLYGTVALLEEEEQQYIKGFLINKFRGDVAILKPGLQMLEDKVQKPVLGVIPYAMLDIDDEDSLSERFHQKKFSAVLNIAIPKLPRISNFTDFHALERLPEVNVIYATDPYALSDVDCIILPGSKNTIEDLRWLRQSGFEARICQCASQGIPVWGICGGYQMMGETISDPHHTESGESIRGMGLLPIQTVFAEQKTMTQTHGNILSIAGMFESLQGTAIEGYEIHMGQSTRTGGVPLVCIDRDGVATKDGCQKGNCYGTYVHGIFDHPAFLKNFIRTLLNKKGYTGEIPVQDTSSYKEAQYDKLANMVRQALDMKQIYRILEEGV